MNNIPKTCQELADLNEIQCFNHGTGNINLSTCLPESTAVIAQLKPVQLHLKEDGALDDTPSFGIVMCDNHGQHVVAGQISLKMLNAGLNTIGYELVKF